MLTPNIELQYNLSQAFN